MRRTAIALLFALLPALALAGPSIVGSMNNWDPADPAYDLVPLGSAYTLTVNLAAGHHEYKCVETDAWEGTDFPWNIMLDLGTDQDITFFANLGATVGLIEFDEYVAHQAPIIAGSFISLWGGNDWDPMDPAGQLVQIDGTDLFVLEGMLPAGHHECKVTLNGNWDQGTGDNFILDLASDTVGVFTYEFGTNTLTFDESVAASESSFSEVKIQF
jgi:hypothetical protein